MPYDIVHNYHLNHRDKSKRIKQKRVSNRVYLLNKYPQVQELWSDKNTMDINKAYCTYNKVPIYWKCPDGKHEDFERQINETIHVNFRCPKCSVENIESYLETKVKEHITKNYNYELKHEYQCTIIPINPQTKRPLPFDNEIIDLKLIIEVNGSQHYDINAYSGIWNKKNITPEEQLHKRKLYDRYKRFIARCNGYFYLEIPYWTDNKDEDWKKLIDDKINEIIKKKIN